MNFRRMVFSSSVLGAWGIFLVVLKLTGITVASWWWILMPFWAPPVMLVLAVLMYAVMICFGWDPG